MQIASFFVFAFFFLPGLQGLEMFPFKPCMLSTGVWGKLTFWWLLCMLEMLVGCRVWLQMCLYAAVVMIKYWCGNLLTSFGEPSTKIVGIFPVCFPKLLFQPDEAQLHIGYGWSFTFLLGFTGDHLLIGYQRHLSRNSDGLGFFLFGSCHSCIWYSQVSPSYFLVYFRMNFYPEMLCGRTELALGWI